MRSVSSAVAVATLLASACIPDLGVRDSLVTRTEVLAVRAEPPEAAPGANVHYDLLVAGPDGIVTAPANWGYCTAAKFLSENSAVSASCLTNAISEVANGPTAVDAPVPANACQVFGPEVTQQDLRPRDPDITGGYYQPLRVGVAGEVAYALERVECPLAFGSAAVADDFGKRYKPNTNPTLSPIAPPTVTRGAHVTLRAEWPAESAEPYVVFDLGTRALADRRESLRASWFATAGTFDADRTGRSAEETETFTDNGWTAPTSAGTVHLFVVLRDDRGGSAFTSFDVNVP